MHHNCISSFSPSLLCDKTAKSFLVFRAHAPVSSSTCLTFKAETFGEQIFRLWLGSKHFDYKLHFNWMLRTKKRCASERCVKNVFPPFSVCTAKVIWIFKYRATSFSEGLGRVYRVVFVLNIPIGLIENEFQWTFDGIQNWFAWWYAPKKNNFQWWKMLICSIKRE